MNSFIGTHQQISAGARAVTAVTLALSILTECFIIRALFTLVSSELDLNRAKFRLIKTLKPLPNPRIKTVPTK